MKPEPHNCRKRVSASKDNLRLCETDLLISLNLFHKEVVELISQEAIPS